MRTMEEFGAFYDGELAPVLTEMEARRRGIWRKFATSVGVTLAAAVALALIGVATQVILLSIFAVIGAILAIGISWAVLTKGFAEEYKRRVVGSLVRFADPSLIYEPKAGISLEQFRTSGMFQHGVDCYHCEDYVKGTVGATAIQFSEVHAEYKTTHRDSRGHTHTEWHTIFRGLFVIADFNKDFRGRTVVLPDVAERSLGWLGQKLQGMAAMFTGAELVKLEDVEFEKEFVVYGTDQVEARYILSPALMQRLMEFKRHTGKAVHFSFVGSNVNVAVSTTHNMFEMSMRKTLLDRAQVEGYLRDLQFALSVVEELDLNTRIWTKE